MRIVTSSRCKLIFNPAILLLYQFFSSIHSIGKNCGYLLSWLTYKKQKLAKNATKFKEKFEYLKTLLHLFYIFKKKIHDAIPGNPCNAYTITTHNVLNQKIISFSNIYILNILKVIYKYIDKFFQKFFAWYEHKDQIWKDPRLYYSINHKNEELMHLDDTFIKNSMEMHLSDLNWTINITVHIPSRKTRTKDFLITSRAR